MDTVYNFKGLVAAVVLPSHTDGSINLDVIPQYVEHLVEHGVKGVFVNGTQGEWSSCTVDERKKVAEAWVKHGKGKMDLIIIHVGSHCMRDAQQLASHAESIGVDAVAVIAPNFLLAPDEDTLTTFLKEIADSASKTPFLYYHLPWMTNIEVDWSNFLGFCIEKIPSFCGMKFTSHKSFQAAIASRSHTRRLKIFSGDDFQLLAAFSMGIDAAVGSSYNFIGKQMNEMIKAFNESDLQKARDIQLKISTLEPFYAKHSLGVGKVLTKIASGIEVGQPRLPLKEIGEKEFEELKKHMEANNFAVKV